MDLRGRTLFVTGVGGFIGLRAAELALERGARVSGVDRSPTATERARARGVDARVADIGDRAALAAAMAGADAVLHTAAIVEESGRLEDFRRVNVDGAVSVAEAAREAGARVMVHLSSVMVYGFDYPPDVAEDGPLAGEGNPYCTTKIESEPAVRAVADPGRFDVIVVRPGDVYGPGSVPWVLRPLDLHRRGIFVLPDGGRGILNHIYVDNLVEGIFAAVEHEAFGETFNLTDGRATPLADFYGRLCAALDLRPPRTLPAALMRPLVRAAVLGSRAVGRTPVLAPEAVRFALRPHAYSNAKARGRLGWEPRIDLDEGIRLTAEWCRGR